MPALSDEIRSGNITWVFDSGKELGLIGFEIE